jgi:hypothetical protein
MHNNFNTIDIKLVNQYFCYDPDTGDIRWKQKTKNTKVGDVAGYVNSNGYRILKLNKQPMTASRLAWVLFYNKNPKKLLDHIDGNRDNNAINNLREVTYQQNNMNTKVRSHNNLGIKGVRKKGNSYNARITKDGVLYDLGWFKDLNKAISCRFEKELELFGEYKSYTYGT